MKTVPRSLLHLGVAAILLWLLWPERFTVNMPSAIGRWFRSAPTTDSLRNRIRLPDGFAIAIYASGLTDARMLRFTAAGDLLVSLPRSGRIVLLERDSDADGRPDGRRDLLTGLDRPHGLDLHEGWLYVAETHALGRVRFDEKDRSVSGGFERLADLPADGQHWTRSVRLGPDGWLYVSVGSSCNACREADPRRAALLRFRPDGTAGGIYATGLRNTVGFDWRPIKNELYGADNGRDLLGDDFPPCELNRIEHGKFYGWPYANGDKAPDPGLGAGNEDKVRASVSPVHNFGAHTAPLGLSFIHGNSLPPGYQGVALAALHGSWNRTEKAGYEVVSLHFDATGKITERKFATGFEQDEEVIGRPVDVAEGPDGAIYISDDYGGNIYRVTYND
ncbi:MAG: PQQ-dependent sugar dehydrogenase [Gammaproteobacteria bacterium]